MRRAVLYSALGSLMLFGALKAVPAGAAPLTASFGFGAIRECTGTAPCGVTVIDQQSVVGWDFNALVDVNVPGQGRAAALPGSNPNGLPELHAISIVTGPATSTAVVLAYQGYRNIGLEAIDVAFAGNLSFVRTGPGTDFVTPALAILDSQIRDEDVAMLWNALTNDGQLTADCSTAAAVSVINPGRLSGIGTVNTTLDTSTGMCGGGMLYSVAPGEEFFVLASLLTFQVLEGTTDAFGTFELAFSPLMSASDIALAEQFLVPISLEVDVPEPAALGLFGLGIFGMCLGRRRGVPSLSSI